MSVEHAARNVRNAYILAAVWAGLAGAIASQAGSVWGVVGPLMGCIGALGLALHWHRAAKEAEGAPWS